MQRGKMEIFWSFCLKIKGLSGRKKDKLINHFSLCMVHFVISIIKIGLYTEDWFLFFTQRI